MSEPWHVAFCADEAYAEPLLVAAGSLLKHSPADLPIVFWLVDGGVEKATQRRIEACLLALGGSRLTLHWRSAGAAKGPLFHHLHFKPANYLRLSLAELLPESVSKVLYLDCDTLTVGDPSPLFLHATGGNPVAAARDLCGTLDNPLAQLSPHLPRLGLAPSAPYFNSGVLVMDLARWRAEGLGPAILDFCLRRPELLFLVDQNALNIFLHGRITELPFRYNHQFPYHRIRSGEWKIPLYEPPAEAAVLYHFVSEQKPWLECSLPEARLWVAAREEIRRAGT